VFSFVAEVSVVDSIAQLIRIFLNHDWGTQVGISMRGSVYRCQPHEWDLHWLDFPASGFWFLYCCCQFSAFTIIQFH